MRKREAFIALLATLLVLLLAGVVGVEAFRMLRQEGQRRELEADRQRVDALQQAGLAARMQARLGDDTNILPAPEVTTASGRETRLQATALLQANLLSVLQTNSSSLPR